MIQPNLMKQQVNVGKTNKNTQNPMLVKHPTHGQIWPHGEPSHVYPLLWKTLG